MSSYLLSAADRCALAFLFFAPFAALPFALRCFALLNDACFCTLLLYTGDDGSGSDSKMRRLICM